MPRSPWLPDIRVLLADADPSAIVPLTGQVRRITDRPWPARRWF